MNTPERLQSYLSLFNRRYSNAWRQFDDFRTRRAAGDKVFQWSEWCFCPLAASYAIISQGQTVPPYALNDIGALGGLVAWRTTQGIYRFDQTVFDAVWNTPVRGKLPVNILFHLPEWCCYIETPGKQFGDDQLNGFFVYLEEDANDKRAELRFVLDCQSEMVPIPIHLSDSSLEVCLSDALAEAERQAKLHGVTFNISSYQKHLCKIYEPLVSLVLYLCSQTAEIPFYESRTQPQYNHKQKRFYPPASPRIWTVGYRLGTAIRDCEKRNNTEDNPAFNEDFHRQSPRAHIRTAHWHGFWTGSRKSEQKFVLKWLPPIGVNVSAESRIIPNIRIVKETFEHSN